MAGNSGDKGRSVISRVSAILATFTENSVYSLTDIATRTGLPLSTTHRLTNELYVCRLLDRTHDGRYVVGVPLQMLQTSHGGFPTIDQAAPDVMEDLAIATRSTVRLGVLDEHVVAYMEKRPGHPHVSHFSDAARLPAHSTALGKALLAFSPPAVVDKVIERGFHTFAPVGLATSDRLRRKLEVVRRQGIAVSRMTTPDGRCAVAMPVFGPSGNVVAALELTVLDPPHGLQHSSTILWLATRSLSRELASRPERDVNPAFDRLYDSDMAGLAQRNG